MSEKNICPGCGRHCDLSEPHCGRGEEYRRTRNMPERQQGKGLHEGTRMAHYHSADMNERLIINLRDLGSIMHFLYEGKASQKRILIILNEAGRITQRDLTERLGIQPGSASEVLSKLENAGWILRTQNEADRRTTDISLTDAGRKLAEEASAQRRKRHEEMFSCLSEEERQELLSLLEKIRADWRTRYSEKGHHGHGPHHNGHHGGSEPHHNEHPDGSGSLHNGHPDGRGHRVGHRRHDDSHEHRGN